MTLHSLFMIFAGMLCGSFLFGSFLPKIMKNIDVTELAEDHNPGTANAMKYAGVSVGMLCLLGDILKGTIPVHLAIRMELEAGTLFPLIMAAPVFGHAYSLFHHGKGGKAIAVTFGVLLGLLPLNTDLLILLCALYIMNSTLIKIHPHTRRTRITFYLFLLGTMALTLLGRVSGALCMGVVLMSGIVIHKNNLRQQIMEESQAAPSKMLTEGAQE